MRTHENGTRPPLMTRGTRLKEAREAAGFTIAKASKAIGVAWLQLAKWERDEVAPDLKNAVAMARLYRISLDEIEGIEPPASREFAEWLGRYAPNDLTDEEELMLMDQRFPIGRHPGPEYYSAALAGIRYGHLAHGQK